MSVWKKETEMSLEVLEVIKKEVTKMLLSRLLKADFSVGDFMLKAPTAINSKLAVEYYDGEKAEFDWDSIPDYFDGCSIAAMIEYLQRNRIRFARALRTRTFIIANDYDEITIMHYNSDGKIVGFSETYEDRFLDAVHEWE